MARDFSEEVANDDRMSELFTFYSDMRGGWLFVPWKRLHDIRFDISTLSDRSYADADGAYLEEDVDMPLFEILFNERAKRRIVLNDIDEHVSSVRTKDVLHDFDWQSIMNGFAEGFI